MDFTNDKFYKKLSLSLLMGSAFITNAMEDDLNKQSNSRNDACVVQKRQAIKVKLGLQDTFTLFENADWTKAYKAFKQFGKSGGFFGSAYMTYMEEKGYVTPTVVHGHFVVEAIPEIGQTLSGQYLQASLAYMEPEKTEKVKKLAPLILNNNPHAVSLMYKLCKQDDSVFQLLLTTKGFKGPRKKYQSPEDLFKNFIPHKNPVICWNYLDPDYFVYLHKNRNQSAFAKNFTITELNYFATNYEKNPHLLGKLARKLATTKDSKQVSQPLFWAHLALENGWGDLCGQLGKSFYDQSRMVIADSQEYRKLTKNKQTNNTFLSSENRDRLELSRYYTYHIQENDLLSSKEVFNLIQHYAAAYEKGTYGKPDKLKGFFFDQKAADLGDSASQYNLAIRLRDGNGVEKDSRKALKYFNLAAAQNNLDAQFNLGVMYRDGDGTEPNVEEALLYFKLAEDQGDQEAKNERIKLLYKAQQNLQEALESLKIYADQGDADAQYKYACMLRETESEFQNFKVSRKYLELSTDQQHKYAAYDLAVMLYGGVGGEKDLERALRNFKKAAAQGIALAQYNYAVMMLNGEGGAPDLQEAQEYFHKAANQGLVEAIIALQVIKEQNSQKDVEIKKEAEILEEDLEIIFSPLQEASLSDFEYSSEEAASEDSIISTPQKTEEAPSPKIGATRIETSQPFEITKEQEEINHLIEKHKQEIIELRIKKRAQKEAAMLSKQTLSMKRKNYDKMKNPSIKETQINTKKYNVAYETLEFVKTIFGVGTRKINAFSIQIARQAFADLGCEVSSKKGENSTKLKFILEGKGIMKFKFHNPHGQGDDLYDDLKPYMKRFLESINKTPDKLRKISD